LQRPGADNAGQILSYNKLLIVPEVAVGEEQAWGPAVPRLRRFVCCCGRILCNVLGTQWIAEVESQKSTRLPDEACREFLAKLRYKHIFRL
jgi:hypothetical protein